MHLGVCNAAWPAAGLLVWTGVDNSGPLITGTQKKQAASYGWTVHTCTHKKVAVSPPAIPEIKLFLRFFFFFGSCDFASRKYSNYPSKLCNHFIWGFGQCSHATHYWYRVWGHRQVFLQILAEEHWVIATLGKMSCFAFSINPAQRDSKLWQWVEDLNYNFEIMSQISWWKVRIVS